MGGSNPNPVVVFIDLIDQIPKPSLFSQETDSYQVSTIVIDET